MNDDRALVATVRLKENTRHLQPLWVNLRSMLQGDTQIMEGSLTVFARISMSRADILKSPDPTQLQTLWKNQLSARINEQLYGKAAELVEQMYPILRSLEKDIKYDADLTNIIQLRNKLSALHEFLNTSGS